LDAFSTKAASKGIISAVAQLTNKLPFYFFVAYIFHLAILEFHFVEATGAKGVKP
jgi:hypothetical protein